MHEVLSAVAVSIPSKITAFDLRQASQYAPWLIALVLLLVIGPQAWQNLELANATLPAESVQTNNKSTPDNTASTSLKASNYRSADIINGHIFGNAGASINERNIPTTQLKLLLRGAFTSSTPSQASAIIEGSDGQTRSYKVGSQVYGQAKVHSVFADHVVLDRNGRLETLLFPLPSSAGSAASSAQLSKSDYQLPENVQSLVMDNMSRDEIQQASKQLRDSSLTTEQRKQLIRKRLQELRDRARSNKS
ncbi:MAG: general secretion pathway protein C [Oceanicoccus sp.]|jgi:general secretion pathway protein C